MTEPSKIPPARVVVRLSYSLSIILPVDEAKQLLGLLAQSESYQKDYDKEPIIKPFQEDVNITYIPEVEYQRLRLAFLRNDE